ncbi:class II fumarate hydratase [Zavarzinia compransoris]|uniref:class II fumarate hydratase n=1 Tax=Zavarzinia marina TaxID=2911065 RepID=UPI001F3B8A23|nr:class II fumarate hydratase [Zavarzinia marina]MCF4164318.1 class II fumarate hydratase [Zavarzinia marina]
MGNTRTERDSFGPIEVPADRLWGANTQRSLMNFPIGDRAAERMPTPIIRGLALVKQAAARVNGATGKIPAPLAAAIADAAAEVAAGKHDAEFPLVVWQTGSGTQSNMNVNEVIANLANDALGGARGAKSPVHPNDHVNHGQSSNDCFPTAIHVAAAEQVSHRLLPGLRHLQEALAQKALEWAHLVKMGRTHLQDAVPLTLGQEFGGYAAQLSFAIHGIEHALDGVLDLAQGGTAVGTGLNAAAGFAEKVAAELALLTGIPFRSAPNKFAALAGHEATAALSAAVEVAAIACFKIASDIRLMGSGPRSGLGELSLPENEPGSSIMPGKVNPTQAEALTMVATRVVGNHATIAFAATQGHFELNVFKPVIGAALLQSIALLGDAARSFADRCVIGATANAAKLDESVRRSLMLVTALAPEIGYDNAAKIAKHAHTHNQTLREAALELGLIDEARLDALLDPGTMLGPDKD